MIIKRKDKEVYLYNDESERYLTRSISSVNESLLRLVTDISEAGYPTDKDYLLGVCRIGSNFIPEQEEKKVREWTKNSPLAEASIRRLVSEAIDAVPSGLLLTIDREISSISSSVVENPLQNWKDYLEYAPEGKVWLSKKYYEDNDKLLYTKITSEELEDVTEFIDIVKRLRKLDEKGYRINNSTRIIMDGRKVEVRGIIGDLLGDRNEPDKRPELSEDKVLLSMKTNLDITFEEYKRRKAEGRLC